MLSGQHTQCTKASPNSNIKYEYSWVSKTLFKAVVFLSSYFPLADLLSGRALFNSLEIRTLIPLISASDSLNEAKTILWKSFQREKSVTSRDAFSGHFWHKENAKNVFFLFFLQSHILSRKHTVKKNLHNLLMEIQESLKIF